MVVANQVLRVSLKLGQSRDKTTLDRAVIGITGRSLESGACNGLDRSGSSVSVLRSTYDLDGVWENLAAGLEKPALYRLVCDI